MVSFVLSKHISNSNINIYTLQSSQMKTPHKGNWIVSFNDSLFFPALVFN